MNRLERPNVMDRVTVSPVGEILPGFFVSTGIAVPDKPRWTGDDHVLHTDQFETLRVLLVLVGMSHAEAGTMFGVASQTVSLKCSGKRGVWSGELRVLRELWLVVRDGRVEDLPSSTPESVRQRCELIRSIGAGST
jgi:hypothetical protein